MPRSRIVTWTLGAVGVLLVGLVALYLTGLDDDPTSSRGEQSSAGIVGEPVVLHGVRYEVTGVRKASRLFAVEKPTQYDEPRQTSGTFVAVSVALTNDADEPAAASFHGSALVGGNGQSYPLDSLSWGTYYDLQPGLRERARLVYDVSPAAAPGAILNLTDCPINDAFEPDDCAIARVDLGLR